MHAPIYELQSILLKAKPRCLERLAARALGSLLDVPVRVARSGDQRGGDGGTSGIGGRELVFEARRYSDKTRFDERGILGEIEQAIDRKPDLEAWILVTTSEVPEQIEQAMTRAGLKNGIGAIIFDWKDQPLPKLAVLTASCPECFEAEIDQDHEHILEQIRAISDYAPTLESIKSELENWSIGYEAVRKASHTWVEEIWKSSRKATARFRQDVAGGEADAHHVRRPDLIDRLDAWLEASAVGEIGALIGPEGVGKTWLAIDWLQSRLVRLPIIVVAPSSAIGNGIASRTDLIRFIARYLHDISGVRNESFWERRVRRLLERPTAEGPAFIIFFDGLNQVASFDWLGVFKQLQDNLFYQRTLTLISVRTSFFEELLERLDSLRSLLTQPRRIAIGNYDQNPGGAFDQKLALTGLSRDDLPDELVKHAVVPRLFDLVIQLKDSLGHVSAVTVNRLLWAYGASTIATSTDGAFSEDGWRRFIIELAQEHRDANRNSTVQRITDLSEDATLTPDRIYQRVSGVIDGIFTELSGEGELRFQEDFVHHALGLALVKRMEQPESDEDATTVLEQFLDPIAGYDARAETLRAAVNIALLRSTPQQPKWLSTLCTFWIHTQNLSDSHLEELAVLAPALVTPLLDVIEASYGHALTTPRHIAINALARVDKSDGSVAREVAERGEQWHRFISLEKRGADLGENSLYAYRCKRLRERISLTEPGQVTVTGRVFEIVDYRDNDLIITASQLLQGRPLADAIEFFETGAIHHAIVGGGTGHESQSWLNALNTVDPEETAEGLRRASEIVRERTPEPGVHSDLNKRIASLLLQWTGYADDDELARTIDPKIDHLHRYETDYLANPSRSFFRLERRHAAQVLRDTGLLIIRRIERAKDALLDPSFEVPPEFVDELLSTGEGFDFSQTATGLGRTRHDHQWERLSLALARCAPEKLADLERKRLLGFSDRLIEQRFGSSLVAPNAMLLAGKEESIAIQTLRELGDRKRDNAEYTTQTNFLISEIQYEPPVAQVQRIMEAGLDQIDSYLAGACDPPTEHEIDLLLDEYGDNEEQLRRLASILGAHDLTFSERAFNTFFNLLKPGDADSASGAVWELLAFNEPVRLGTMLDYDAWSWSSERHIMENLMGSVAIAESNRDAPFTEYAQRVAPAQLLETLSQEERSREDVELAVELLTGVLFGDSKYPPEPGVVISHEQDKTELRGYQCTIGDVYEEGENQDNFVRSVERFNSPEKHEKRRREIVEAYLREVKEARQSGAQLYLVHFTADNFEPVLKHSPDAVETWLEGLESSSPDFIRRVRLAEGFFVALCEALLKKDPPRGISLWRALRKCLVTRFIGHANIDRLVYALFAAAPHEEVGTTLEEIYDIREARSDDELMNLIIAARLSSRNDWLRRMVRRDAESSCPLHRQRATFLEPLLVRPDIVRAEYWPEGEAASVYDNIHEASWILAQREAFATHWLQKFSEADTVETAYAYWRLFKACGDRRASIWRRSIYESHATRDEILEAVKQKFIKQEEHNLKNAMEENEKSWSNNFAWRRYPNSLMPWRSTS